jgi:hypothetical protein
MSRTYRRRGERHEYRWVLREWVIESGRLTPVVLDRHSPEGRRAIARIHSDAHFTMHCGVPRWLADPGYDPLMNARHRSSAKWAWW